MFFQVTRVGVGFNVVSGDQEVDNVDVPGDPSREATI